MIRISLTQSRSTPCSNFVRKTSRAQARKSSALFSGDETWLPKQHSVMTSMYRVGWSAVYSSRHYGLLYLAVGNDLSFRPLELLPLVVPKPKECLKLICSLLLLFPYQALILSPFIGSYQPSGFFFVIKILPTLRGTSLEKEHNSREMVRRGAYPRGFQAIACSYTVLLQLDAQLQELPSLPKPMFDDYIKGALYRYWGGVRVRPKRSAQAVEG